MTAPRELSCTVPEASRAGPDGTRAARWLILIAVLVPLILVLTGWTMAPSVVNPDSAMGFLVWQSRAAGAAWNHLQTVDPADISRDCSAFLSWWSPGQYEIPGVFRTLGFSWGHVILLTAIASSWIGTWGAWKLARAVGGSDAAAGTFCVLNALEWHSLYGFGQFRGGDVLLAAATPWVLIWAWQVRHRPWWFAVTVPAVIVGGFYLKLSAGLFTLPLLAGVGLSVALRLRDGLGVLAVWTAATAAIAYGSWLLVRVGYLDQAPNPGNLGQVHQTISAALGFSALAPWLAATGAQSAIGRILWVVHKESSVFWASSGPAAVVVGTCVCAAGGMWISGATQRTLRVPVVFVVGCGSLLLAVLAWRGANIGLDDRYLRPVATLVLLILALDIDDTRRWRLTVAITAVLLIGGFGAGAAAQRTWRLAAMHQGDGENLTQQQLSPAAITECARIDAATPPRTAVIYVPSPEIAFDFPRQRVLATGDLSEFRAERRHGRVPQLVVLTSDAMVADGRATAVKKSFVDYRENEWRGVHRTGWWFWTARSAEPAHPQ